MFRNMATALLEHERIETTVGKAKDLRGVTERLITIGREDTLHNRRKAYSYLMSKKVVHKLFTEIGPRYKDRPGGYTRVLKTRVRAGDAAAMAIIELVEEEVKKKKKMGSSRKRKAADSTKKDSTKKEAKPAADKKEAKETSEKAPKTAKAEEKAPKKESKEEASKE